MYTGTTIEDLIGSVERAELHALQLQRKEMEVEGNKYLVYRTNYQQMIEVA
jgi:hypothetical protein